MGIRNSRFCSVLGNHRGIALPVALLALIAISVLITGLLLTSSTEAALSFAHRDATENLHVSAGAIEAYAARQASLPQVETITLTPPGSATPVRLTVEQLAKVAPAPSETDSSTYYSVKAEPVGGGRGVVAIIRAIKNLLPNLNTDIECALCLGASGQVSGTAPPGDSIKISNGANSQSCSAADSAGSAITYSADAAVTISGTAADEIHGDTIQSQLSREAMISAMLGGISMRDMAWNADIKFGSYFNEAPFDSTKKVFSVKNGNLNTEAKYNWSCPGEMDDKQNCASYHGTKTDTTYYPVIAIDGGNSTVVLDNWHGQGMLIVINGTLKIAGQFLWKGLILAERNVVITGGGSTPPSIEGAIVSAGEMVVDGEQELTLEGSTSAGKAQITFNRCALSAVQNAFNGDGTAQWGAPKVRGRTLGWFELIR